MKRPHKDWWDDLTPGQIEQIEISVRELAAGQGLSLDEFKKMREAILKEAKATAIIDSRMKTDF